MQYKANSISPGVTLGKALVYKPAVLRLGPERYSHPATEELARLDAALQTAREELETLAQTLGGERGKIFIAHREILGDEEILAEVRQAVVDGSPCPHALAAVYGQYIALLAGAGDELLAARADDLRDVQNRLLRALGALEGADLSALSRPVVLVARDLLPGDTATLNRDLVQAIVTEIGGPTSHTAILANSFGIPAVAGVEDCTTLFATGDTLGVDALSGTVIHRPNGEEAKALEKKRSAWLAKKAAEAEYAAKPCTLACGARLEIGCNIGSDRDLAGLAHADFVGLFRSEFLYMESSALPGEETQYEAYSRVVKAAKGKPVTLRTLDIGGDKALPYLPLPAEDNPFLGNRALRLCLEKPQLLLTQLRAALRAAQHGPLQIRFHMVGGIEDIHAARNALKEAAASLTKDGLAHGHAAFGIMIEIPAIAAMADLAAPLVDFASIGTNDLCQYLCAADRLNPAVASYYQSHSPALLRTVAGVSKAFAAAGKPLSVCGELAGDETGAVLLAGLGLQKLSMSAAKVPAVKARLAGITLQKAQSIALQALQCATQQEVKDLFV